MTLAKYRRLPRPRLNDQPRSCGTRTRMENVATATSMTSVARRFGKVQYFPEIPQPSPVGGAFGRSLRRAGRFRDAAGVNDLFRGGSLWAIYVALPLGRPKRVQARFVRSRAVEQINFVENVQRTEDSAAVDVRTMHR